MAIQDSDPERRNLNLLSVSFILFCWADGAFTEKAVRLSVVNIDFSYPERLGYFVWGLLFWFVFRYWLTHQGQLRKVLFAGFKLLNDKRDYATKIVKNRTKLVPNENNGFYRPSFWIDNKGWYITYTKIKEVTETKNGEVTGCTTDGEDHRIDLNSIKDVLIKARILLVISLVEEGASSYLTPYILFIIAVIFGLVRVFQV